MDFSSYFLAIGRNTDDIQLCEMSLAMPYKYGLYQQLSYIELLHQVKSLCFGVKLFYLEITSIPGFL